MNENENEVTECLCSIYKKDCDGDYEVYCTKYGSCPYQKIVKDCDGDTVVLCRA